MDRNDDDVVLLGEQDARPRKQTPPLALEEDSGGSETCGKTRSADIAIIGISGRFAGSVNLEAFWDHLKE